MKNKNKLLALYWFGGKYYHMDDLRQYMPQDAKHFIDVYGGSASVILNVDRYYMETYNDLNPYIATFFKVLKNNTNEFIDKLRLTPYSCEEFVQAVKYRDCDSDMETARRIYIRSMQAITGRNERLGKGSWASKIKGSSSRYRMSGRISVWIRNTEDLKCVAERLKHINIENMHALDLIKKHDSTESLFYLDPPYINSTRINSFKIYGKFDMEDKDHMELAELLNNIKGRAVLSGYRNDLYDKIFKGWKRIDFTPKFSFTARSYRQESIWQNF